MDKTRRRLYEVVTYSSDMLSDIIFSISHNVKNCRWYWSFHDKDKYDHDVTDDEGNITIHQGDIKKAHYHILLYFNDGVTLSSVMKNANISDDMSNMIEFWKKGDESGRLDYRVRYLVHYKNTDDYKFEYPIDNIHSNDDNYLRFFENDVKMMKDIALLFDFFDNQKSLISYRTFLNYIYSADLWSTYRSNALIFNRLFDEHNHELREEVPNPRIQDN